MPHAPVPAPAFWFGFELAWAKLVIVRCVVFGLLAVDALLQIPHAPRYGAGGFNVAQLPGLDALGAGRASYAIAQLASAYLLALAACGVATRVVVPVAATLYAWLYFGSQLDSYQHHYLVALVLLVACFVPWQRPDGAEPASPVRSWAVRLILVELGVMYFWAAVSKLDAAWLEGRTLSTQLTGSVRSVIEGGIGFSAAAWLTVLLELVLAVTVWLPRAWWLALPLGVAFHLGIIASGLEIGLFAWLMLGFYLLVVPDGAYVAVARTWLGRVIRGLASAARADASGGRWGVLALELGLGLALAWTSRLDHAVPVAIALAVATVALVAATRRRARGTDGAWVSAGHGFLLAMALWLAVDRSTSVAVDYYRFWGGSARRLDDPAASERAYRRLIEIAPDEPAGHYQLGRLLLARGEEQPGLAALREAQRLEPRRARAWVAEAEYLRTRGRISAAREKAQEALYAEPGHPGARRLLDSLAGDTPVPGGPAGAPARPAGARDGSPAAARDGSAGAPATAPGAPPGPAGARDGSPAAARDGSAGAPATAPGAPPGPAGAPAAEPDAP